MPFVLPDASAGPIPEGLYTLIFVGDEEIPADLDKGYKAAIKFNFEVAEGPHTGSRVGRICGIANGAKAALPGFLTGLMGQPPKPGTIDVSPYIGRKYRGQVAKTESGNGVRVVSVMPI